MVPQTTQTTHLGRIYLWEKISTTVLIYVPIVHIAELETLLVFWFLVVHSSIIQLLDKYSSQGSTESLQGQLQCQASPVASPCSIPSFLPPSMGTFQACSHMTTTKCYASVCFASAAHSYYSFYSHPAAPYTWHTSGILGVRLELVDLIKIIPMNSIIDKDWIFN